MSGLKSARAFPMAAFSALLFGMAVLIAGCTSSTGFLKGSTDTAAAVSATDVSPASATFGSGDTIIGLVAFDEPLNLSDGAPASVYMAAKLAVQALSGGPATVVMRREQATDDFVRTAVDQFVQTGAGIIIGGIDVRTVSPLGNAAWKNGIPTLSLTRFADIGSGIYSAGLASNEEAVKAVNEAARRGYRSLAVVSVLGGASADYSEAIISAANDAGIKAIGVDGTTPAQFTTGLHSIAQALGTPSAIVFATGPQRAATLMREIRKDISFAKVAIIGNSDWALTNTMPADLKGAWYAGIESAALGKFAEKFKAAYGVAPTMNAAITYDLVILAAVLPQSVPSDPYAAEVLTNPGGFSGFTGTFGFGPTGSLSARNYKIVTIR